MNSADFLIKGTANTKDFIKSRSALPLDGNKGGLPELIIDSKNVKITDFSVILKAKLSVLTRNPEPYNF